VGSPLYRREGGGKKGRRETNRHQLQNSRKGRQTIKENNSGQNLPLRRLIEAREGRGMRKRGRDRTIIFGERDGKKKKKKTKSETEGEHEGRG